jgi:hypothetical protein
MSGSGEEANNYMTLGSAERSGGRRLSKVTKGEGRQRTRGLRMSLEHPSIL